MENYGFLLTEPILNGVDLPIAKRTAKIAMFLSFLFGIAAVFILPLNRRQGEPTTAEASELWAFGRPGGLRAPAALQPRMRPSMRTPKLAFTLDTLSDTCYQISRGDCLRTNGDTLRANAEVAELEEIPSLESELPAEFRRFRTFDGDKGVVCLTEVIRKLRANMREGTAHSRTRAEVRGGGKKPYAQKKTGRARKGSSRSPLCRGGGKSHGPKPRDWSEKIPTNMANTALERALFESAKAGVMELVEDYGVVEGRTKEVAEFLKPREIEFANPNRKTTRFLIVDKNIGEYEDRATRNIPFLETKDSISVNCMDVVKADKILITPRGLDRLCDRLDRRR